MEFAFSSTSHSHQHLHTTARKPNLLTMESDHRFVFVIGKSARCGVPPAESHSRLGPPGAGKGTLSKILARDYQFAHISVGDLLRQVASDPSTSNVVRGYIDCGGLLPSEHLFPILRARFRQCGRDQPIVLDGFPRHLNQAVQFEKEVGLHQVIGPPSSRLCSQSSVRRAGRRPVLQLPRGLGQVQSALQTG